MQSAKISFSRVGAVAMEGRLYGSGEKAIVFSNMDTNAQSKWAPIVESLAPLGCMMLTYDYLERLDDQSRTLEDVVAAAKASGARRIVLIGASRGGVASIKLASRAFDDASIAGLAALSAPIEYEGTIFYGDDELGRIAIRKLLINSKGDVWSNDTRRMYEIFKKPKKLCIYPGDAHGTELFARERESIQRELIAFIKNIF